MVSFFRFAEDERRIADLSLFLGTVDEIELHHFPKASQSQGGVVHLATTDFDEIYGEASVDAGPPSVPQIIASSRR